MKAYLILLLFFLFSTAFAQESNSLLFRVGVGTYSMKSQKLLQQDFNTNSRIPFRAVHSFPPFMTFGGSFGVRISERASVGLWAEYASTGGRLSYSDYSGHATIDQALNSYQIGPFAQYRINKSIDWPIYVTLHSSLVRTNQKLTSEIEVGANIDKENFTMKSTNYGLRPGIMLTRDLHPFTFQAGLGAELQFHGDMDVKSNNAIFTTSDGKNLVSQWDGLRLTLGIGFKL